MAGQSFFTIVNNVVTRVFARQTGFGNAANAGQLVATGADDRLDMSVMPVGIGADTKPVVITENLAAGAWVNLYNDGSANGGLTKARNADSSAANLGKCADGFVLAASASGATATVYCSGQNTAVTGQSPGTDLYLGVAGAGSTTPDTTAGHTYQRIGKVLDTGDVEFKPYQPIQM